MDNLTNASPDAFNSREAAANRPELVVVFMSSNAAPTVAEPAQGLPVLTFFNTTLHVLGADDGGEGALTYTWETVGTPPAPVLFPGNGTNAAKQLSVHFTKEGDYRFRVTIRDAQGASVTSECSVFVERELGRLEMRPATVSIGALAMQTFTLQG